MPEIILSDYFCSDESEEFVYFKVPRRHEQYKFPLCFTKGHFSKTAELWHFLRLIRQGATCPPVFSCRPAVLAAPSQNLWPAGHQSDSNSYGDQFSSLRRQSAENCEGAEPTFDHALRPAFDNLPAVTRGGLPSRRHTSNATLSTIKNRLRPPPCPTLTALASFFSLFLGTALSFRHEPQKAGKVTTHRTFPAVILIWIISELKTRK